ncbi:sigma factor [Micromonospora sp. M12]
MRLPGDAQRDGREGTMAPARNDGRDGYLAFVETHQHRLLRAAYLICGNQHQAEDLLQDALLKLALRWTSVRSGDPPRTCGRSSTATRCRGGVVGDGNGSAPHRRTGWSTTVTARYG